MNAEKLFNLFLTWDCAESCWESTDPDAIDKFVSKKFVHIWRKALLRSAHISVAPDVVHICTDSNERSNPNLLNLEVNPGYWVYTEAPYIELNTFTWYPNKDAALTAYQAINVSTADIFRKAIFHTDLGAICWCTVNPFIGAPTRSRKFDEAALMRNEQEMKIEYRGCWGSVHLSKHGDLFIGKLLDISETYIFEGTNLFELDQNFCKTVDQYILDFEAERFHQ